MSRMEAKNELICYVIMSHTTDKDTSVFDEGLGSFGVNRSHAMKIFATLYPKSASLERPSYVAH